MDSEITMDKDLEVKENEERGLLGDLEEKIEYLLTKYQEMKKEKEDLLGDLKKEREKVLSLKKRIEFITQEREQVKLRIDQLLKRLSNIDI